jgi:hypothetical protein
MIKIGLFVNIKNFKALNICMIFGMKVILLKLGCGWLAKWCEKTLPQSSSKAFHPCHFCLIDVTSNSVSRI